MNATHCTLPECQRPHHSHGLCHMHAERLRRTGDARAVSRTSTLDSFWSRVDKTSGCWLWTGSVLNSGYGQIATRLRPTSSGTRLAHRVAYELLVGPIGDLQLDHLCRNRLCVNPAHLEPVDAAENTRRGLHGSLRTHCMYGHELTAENTWYEAKTNCRRCVTCARATSRRTALRNRVGNESYNRSRRKPCSRCGGIKGPGKRKKLCDNCAGRGE